MSFEEVAKEETNWALMNSASSSATRASCVADFEYEVVEVEVDGVVVVDDGGGREAQCFAAGVAVTEVGDVASGTMRTRVDSLTRPHWRHMTRSCRK
ncbi:hypothetical protein Pelo_18908 [Pelomyxa schiedti]|nr:hypothetical protein Pelo_18908 [Pelomyxa schiedti]